MARIRTPEGDGREPPVDGFADPAREWTTHWSAFLGDHGGWWARVGSDGPVYHLPGPVVTELARTLPK